jgi:hypothetical protein
MKHLKKINELRNPGIILNDPVLEMAQVNDPKDIPYDIYIYGGDSYIQG